MSTSATGLAAACLAWGCMMADCSLEIVVDVTPGGPPIVHKSHGAAWRTECTPHGRTLVTFPAGCRLARDDEGPDVPPPGWHHPTLKTPWHILALDLPDVPTFGSMFAAYTNDYGPEFTAEKMAELVAKMKAMAAAGAFAHCTYKAPAPDAWPRSAARHDPATWWQRSL